MRKRYTKHTLVIDIHRFHALMGIQKAVQEELVLISNTMNAINVINKVQQEPAQIEYHIHITLRTVAFNKI